ncbi:MAG TPA: tetratricopeptide repeat protein [Bryobacteraceae bacterium]|nr:tetratricopeptide repeat protein [Bryobacteraceae bacterium]
MKRVVAFLFLFLLLNAAYIAAFPSATVFYMGNVLLHVLVGFGLTVVLVRLLVRRRQAEGLPYAAAALLLTSAVLAAYLTAFGAIRAHRWALNLHIITAVAGVLLLLPWAFQKTPVRFRNAFVACLITLLVVPLAGRIYRARRTRDEALIRNSLTVPTSMAGEGAGPSSPFWPSSSNTNTGKIIPSNFFMDSKGCGECHKDIYAQWQGSAHHFASFNNQFYRKAIEYMQDVEGTTKGSKWCAGCHDHAVFFNGRFDRPIKQQIDTPEAQNGLGCMSCHAITAVHSSMGNGDFTVTYPPLHELADSKNPIIHGVDRFLTYLNPEPHRETFLKPFMRDNAEFCGVCHKVHLDVPVNNYRWIRGFNDYDNWQASGVSGMGARSFYYPPKSLVCTNCHMPKVRSNDPGNVDGFIHSHRFPAANTAVAYVNHDQEQLKAEEDFLKSGFITVDLFAASPVQENAAQLQMKRRASDNPTLSSTFAVGEEAEQQGPVFIREVGKVKAPLELQRFSPGETIRVDAVVRTRTIGHFFPGGTVDAPDVWLEMQGRDADGRIIYWSGYVEDNGCGPVEPGAHFYKSYQLDGDGNPINKRNGWATRSVLYVHLIPPGAADVAHFLIKIPSNAKGPVTLTAKLNYRKFMYDYVRFAYAGKPKPGQEALVNVDHDDREFSYSPANIPADVSGRIKGQIPNIPIVTMATAKLELPLGNETPWQPILRKQDRERWNDWGIGMLLQGDLKGAEYAFHKVTEADPSYADGWLNIARALIQEGETDEAKPYIDKAMSLNSHLGRVYFFKAMVQKSDGDYDGALSSLRTCSSMYPHDRVVLNQMGRILFLKRDYADAVNALDGALEVDPEDLQAHYNLMLCYRGLGRPEQAEHEQALFMRFKANEAAQAITARRRMLSPEDNNERQPIHDHDNAWRVTAGAAASE